MDITHWQLAGGVSVEILTARRCELSGQPEPTTAAPRGAGPRRRPFTTRCRRVVAIAAIGTVIAGSLAFWLSGVRGSGPDTTIVRNGEVWLQGEITQDTCYNPIPDAGCSITVNGYEIFIVYGNAIPPRTPGTVTGLGASTDDQTGSHAIVYAQLVGPHSASIFSVARYYARISGRNRAQDLIGLALKAAAVICVAILVSRCGTAHVSTVARFDGQLSVASVQGVSPRYVPEQPSTPNTRRQQPLTSSSPSSASLSPPD
jgi:hypothetical protein